MSTRKILGIFIVMAIGRSAAADDKYTLHENVHAGQKISYTLTQDIKDSLASTVSGVKSTESTMSQSWKVTDTILAVKGGSATRPQMEVDPGSSDTWTNPGQPEKKSPRPYAGKTVTLTSQPDSSVANDFQGNAGGDDQALLNVLLSPDEANYPDQPIAVGESWDNSAKLRKMFSVDPKDQFSADFKLDSVTTVGGKQMGRITFKIVHSYHDDSGSSGLPTDTAEEQSGTIQVDIADGMVVKGDTKDLTTATSVSKNPVGKLVDVSEHDLHCQAQTDAGASANPIK